jgi:hypothetical protein
MLIALWRGTSMSRRSQVLFAVCSIPVAAGLGIVGAFLPVPPLAFGALFLALIIVLLVWHRLALRAYQGAGVVVFSRGPWPVIIGLILIEAVCALDVLLAPAGGDRIWLFLGYFLFGILCLAYLPSALLFWVADDVELTSQMLSFKRSLPWREIDWLYLESNETRHKEAMVITVAKWKDEQLIVEAGPGKSMQVLVRTPLAGGAPSPLLQAIRARAINALVGLDQLPVVQARRRGQTPALAPQPEPNVSLHDAIEIARGPTMPASWTRFSVRRDRIWPNLLLSTALAMFSVGSGAFIVASGTVVGIGMIPADWLVGPQKPLALAGEALLFAGIGLWLFSMSLRWLRTVRHPEDHFFLVTPRYVAEVRGRKVEGVALADVRDIHRSGGGNYGW